MIVLNNLFDGSTKRSLEATIELLETNDDAVGQGLMEVFKRQTADEREEKSTKHRNRFGFSKKHVTPGTKYAIKYMGGVALTSEEMTEARRVALHYRNQIWLISLGGVPVNNIGQ